MVNCFLGKPDPPMKMDVLDISKTSATLGWVKPLRDGGSKIDGYVVDYHMVVPPKEPVEGEPLLKKEEKPAVEWTPYSVVKDLTIVVVGLKEGKKYRFRVAARNAVGCSLPTETKGEFEMKEQMCKIPFFACHIYFTFFSVCSTIENAKSHFHASFISFSATNNYYA